MKLNTRLSMKIVASSIFLTICVPSTLLAASAARHASPPAATLTNKQIVLHAVTLFENPKATPADFSRYISPNYIQISDGHTLNYSEFLSHVAVMHARVKSMHFQFKQIISEGDIVATHHMVTSVMQNGQVVQTELFAFFTIQHHHIVKCEEISRLLAGAPADNQLAYQVKS